MTEKRNQFIESLKNDKGDAERWYDPSVVTDGWKKIKLPQLWEQTEIGNADGHVWFRKEIELSPSWEGKPVLLSVGTIDDNDVTYVNGKQVGATNSYNEVRNYKIPAGIIKKRKEYHYY